MATAMIDAAIREMAMVVMETMAVTATKPKRLLKIKEALAVTLMMMKTVMLVKQNPGATKTGKIKVEVEDGHA